jgi:2-oxoglutarate dehydrogenase E2 component (dihydrolipoamide succinyltransferase)
MKEVKLPELVENMERAIISFWHIEEGDPVAEGDELVEVTVDSNTYNVISPSSGILNEVFFEEGDEVEVGEVLAAIEEEGREELDFGLESEEEDEY